MRLARTIADLEGAPSVRRVHVAEALIYRRIAPAAESLGEHRASAYEVSDAGGCVARSFQSR